MAVIEKKSLSSGPFVSTKIVSTAGGIPVGDKAVGADFFAAMMNCIVSDGVANTTGNDLEVTPNSLFSIKVRKGCAWAKGHMAMLPNDTEFKLTNNKEYKVVLRFDFKTGAANLMVVTDPDGDYPVRSVDYFDLVLAEIDLSDGVSKITEDEIYDTRDDEDYCGFAGSNL